MAMREEIAARLVAQGVGTAGVNLFAGRMPDEPDTCLALYARSGPAPIRAMGSIGAAPIADQPQVQCLARGADDAALNTLVANVLAALDHFSGTLSGTRYLYISLAYDPVDVGQDENGRPMKSLLFSIKKERS